MTFSVAAEDSGLGTKEQNPIARPGGFSLSFSIWKTLLVSFQNNVDSGVRNNSGW